MLAPVLGAPGCSSGVGLAEPSYLWAPRRLGSSKGCVDEAAVSSWRPRLVLGNAGLGRGPDWASAVQVRPHQAGLAPPSPSGAAELGMGACVYLFKVVCVFIFML